MSATLQIDHLLPAWERFRAATDIGPIRDEAHCARMTAALEHLLDAAAGDESHPAMALADIVGDLIEDYEARRHPLPEATGVQALEFLMRQHGLRQSDLPEVGSQGVVSREALIGSKWMGARDIGMGCKARTAAIACAMARIRNAADRPRSRCARREGFDQRFPKILAGKRELNLRQVRALAARFGVAAATFI